MRAALITALIGIGGSAVARAQTPGDQVRRLSVDEAVRLALDNNLGVQIARINPQLQDLAVALAHAAWVPTFNTTVQGASTDIPNTSFLSGTTGSKVTNGRLASNIGVLQQTPWGGSYSVGWDSSRQTTTNIFSNFSPQLQSSLSLNIRQPLLRNFGMDSLRQQVILSEKNREISDIEVEQTVATTSRAVRNAYWDLAYALASLAVQQQSLDLARESLRETNARIQIGTTPPIDAVEAEAEVATRDEAVIVAQAQIENAQDALRTLVFNQAAPDFWTARIEPTDLPAFEPARVDVDGAVRNALQMRTDLLQARKSLEENDINVRYYRNQTLPDVTASFDYGLTGLGGTQFVRGTGFPGPIIGATQRSFGSVIGDLFGNQFPNWTLALNISYPMGRSQQEASLARAQLEGSQAVTQLKNAELQVVTQVRNVARSVQTNAKRVESTRVARSLAEQRLDAEQKKLAAGTSTNFVVFQAQRDLAQARNNELSAVLDYDRSVVDFETVQRAPVAGAGLATASTVTSGTLGAGATAAPAATGGTLISGSR
ncbi:MAG TPA: TolC family protein [Vicinamibacterales bacterium]|jgi:outer membrane protein TolC|nr:TolC family protein [Vicinamibacterales bacterium]